MENESKSKISNIEWGLVIAALFTIDLIQIGIEWLMSWWGVGIFINWIIDVVVGMSFALYLQLRGQSMANPKRLFALLATFGLEMIPVVSELPLWGLDGIFNMTISKSDKILKNIPGGAIASKSIESANKMVGRDNRPITKKITDSTKQIRELDERIKSRRGENE